jgi:RNA polymerase sigma-70 factor (ECF subfamily)
VPEGVPVRDRAARAELFDRYFGDIYSLAFRLLESEAAAEDATRDIFLRVYRSAEAHDPAGDPRPWLMTIAYDVCRKRWRSRDDTMRRTHFPGDQPTGARPPEAHSPGAAPTDRERAVSRALMSLSEEQRAILLLHDQQGLTHQEIASVVHASPAAVGKQYAQGLSTFRSALKDGAP